MNGSNIGTQSGLIWGFIGMTILLLALVSVLYNWLVGKLGERKEGYTSLMVVGGVFFTSLIAGLIDYLLHLEGYDLNIILINLVAFTASGIPMIVGEIVRYDNARRAAIERQLRQAEQDAEVL